MQETVKGTGTVLVVIGVLAFAVGVLLVVGAQSFDGLVLLGSGFGTVVSGIFFHALAEIIRRLPEPIETSSRTCPQCAGPVRHQARICGTCGFEFKTEAQSLQGGQESIGKLMPCPSCRRNVPRQAARCPFCKEPFAGLRALGPD